MLGIKPAKKMAVCQALIVFEGVVSTYVRQAMLAYDASSEKGADNYSLSRSFLKIGMESL